MLGSLNISRRVLLVLAIGMATPAFVSVQSLINFRHLLLEQRKAEVRHLDEAAWATVAGYQHEAAAGVLTEREAQDAAKSAVRSMRYDGANYFFIWDLQGTGIAHGGNAKLEGKNFISGPDAAQSPGVADMVGKLVRIARDEHEGFARYMIPKAGQTIPLEKIGYSKLFAPWGWAIGTGAYVADIDAIFWSEARADLIMTTLLTMLAGVVSYLLGRDLSLSIRRLTGAMKRLAEGNLSANIPSLARRDEVGVMARAVNIFKDSAIRKQELEAEKAAEQKTTADSADLVVSSIGKCLERLAAGDLTDRLHASLPQAYQKLGTDMNSAMGQLDYLVQSIVANTTAIRSGTSEIAHAADDLSQRTEQQASRLESTAAALNEITATVNQTAESSNQAREIVSAAREDAERGEAIVREAIGAMATIEQSSHEIGQIVSVIDQIAFQTNLLALNAGIEAAQAGEAGRGFEIVASEVRALARRSAEAANAIKTLVSASSQQVTRGVHLVGETGQALGRIAGEVGAINAMVVKIAVAAQDQAAGLHQVNASVHHMDLVTQQNAELAAQSTAACHALMQESEKLSQLTGRFRIADVKQPAARSATPHDSVGVSRKLKSTTRAVGAAGDEGPRARRLAG